MSEPSADAAERSWKVHPVIRALAGALGIAGVIVAPLCLFFGGLFAWSGHWFTGAGTLIAGLMGLGLALLFLRVAWTGEEPAFDID